MRKNVAQIQEAQRVPVKIYKKRPTPRQISIKMARFKDKERILKEARKKQLVTYKGTPIRLSANFSTETLSQKEMAISIPSKEKQRLATKTTLPSKLSFTMEGKLRSFTHTKKRRPKEYQHCKRC